MLSVIIPTCHRNDLLGKCLDRLAPGRQTLGAEKYEVIVTDDGAESTAEDFMRKRYPWARWVEGPRKGPAANRNHGAKYAEGEWLVFTDDDCLPDKGFLAGFLAAAMKNDAEVLEGKTSPAGIRTRVDMECPANETGGYLWSCNMAVRKNEFLEMGGFDENFPGPGMEDVDFRTRLQKTGKAFVFVPDALVLHPWRERRTFRFQRTGSLSVAYYAAKHPEKLPEFNLRSLLFCLVRKLAKELPPVVTSCRGRGAIRDVALSLHMTGCLIYDLCWRQPINGKSRQ